MNIDPSLVVEHIQKQAGESEVVKFALDAAMRQALLIDRERTLEAMEKALEQEKRKVKELQEAIINDLERSTGPRVEMDGQAAQRVEERNGGGDKDELAKRPELVRGGGQA